MFANAVNWWENDCHHTSIRTHSYYWMIKFPLKLWIYSISMSEYCEISSKALKCENGFKLKIGGFNNKHSAFSISMFIQFAKFLNLNKSENLCCAKITCKQSSISLQLHSRRMKYCLKSWDVESSQIELLQCNDRNRCG